MILVILRMSKHKGIRRRLSRFCWLLIMILIEKKFFVILIVWIVMYLLMIQKILDAKKSNLRCIPQEDKINLLMTVQHI